MSDVFGDFMINQHVTAQEQIQKLKSDLKDCETYGKESDQRCATLISENARLKGEVEQLSDVLKTSQLVANLKSFEKCAADLQRHKDALKEARSLADKVNEWYEGKHEYAVDFLEDIEKQVTASRATINKVLGETEGK